MAYQHILVDSADGVGVVTFNRPDARNALCNALADELAEALAAFDADDAIGCVVLTGSDKVFAAGADIKELQDSGFIDLLETDPFSRSWESVARMNKPIVAAVAGYALGGGCEMAMMCDFIIAAENAKFGQPEITIGIMPGAGGTQRLPRAVGKAKAMEMCLTGRLMDAQEAERAGLVSRIVAVEDLRDQALEVARRIASMSRPIVRLTKEAVNISHEMTLAEGLRFERRLFQAMFATEDQKEGMAAFVDKRAPHFKNK